MGLDTSHGCWHGPYSAFNRWRGRLHALIIARRVNTPSAVALGYTYDDCIKGKCPWPYEDQADPLNFLMSHSDCDGEIPAEMCGPLADALQALVDEHMPARALYDDARPATERFITGLRCAAEAGEAVRFG